jgi:hypothetical protein
MASASGVISSQPSMRTTTDHLLFPTIPVLHRYTGWPRLFTELLGILFGIALVVLPYSLPVFHSAGLQALGPLLGILFTVFSLFGELPTGLRWTQQLGSWMFAGIALGTIWLLLPLTAETSTRESSLLAFSPQVWAAYVSIILVSLAFEQSSVPLRIYHFCQSLKITPAVLIPLFIVIAGLMGNLLDGVSIIAISSVIFLMLLDRTWALRAAFALLFGGLISNLVTVAAEPTNIKFQDVLGSVLDRVSPPYWFSNWPICLLGILLPAIALMDYSACVSILNENPLAVNKCGSLSISTPSDIFVHAERRNEVWICLRSHVFCMLSHSGFTRAQTASRA